MLLSDDLTVFIHAPKAPQSYPRKFLKQFALWSTVGSIFSKHTSKQTQVHLFYISQ